jgi:hypothetical protein
MNPLLEKMKRFCSNRQKANQHATQNVIILYFVKKLEKEKNGLQVTVTT